MVYMPGGVREGKSNPKGGIELTKSKRTDPKMKTEEPKLILL